MTTATQDRSITTAAPPPNQHDQRVIDSGRTCDSRSTTPPDSLIPTMFIPLFFLVVNVGQAARIFPSGDTPFLEGQNYGAFQLPASLLLAASFGSAALYLVEEIEGGYFDKLRAAPISRMSLILGRLYAEFVKTGVVAAVMVLLALMFGIRSSPASSGLSCWS